MAPGFSHWCFCSFVHYRKIFHGTCTICCLTQGSELELRSALKWRNLRIILITIKRGNITGIQQENPPPSRGLRSKEWIQNSWGTWNSPRNTTSTITKSLKRRQLEIIQGFDRIFTYLCNSATANFFKCFALNKKT